MTFSITTADLFSGRTEVQGTLENVGGLKVPCMHMYPSGATPFNGMCIVEAESVVSVEIFGLPVLNLDVLMAYIGPERLVEDYGFAYFSVAWHKLAVDSQVGINTSLPQSPARTQLKPFDAGWNIPAGSDVPDILAEASSFVRTPTTLDPLSLSPPAPAAATEVMLAGLSISSAVVRDFFMNSRNTGLGGAFPAGKVFDAGLAFAGGTMTRLATDTAANGYAAYTHTTGATPASEGPYLSLVPETDMAVLGGFKARPAVTEDHYRQLEFAAYAHVSFTQVSPIQLRFDHGPPLMAMVEALRAKVQDATALLDDAYLDGTPTVRGVHLAPAVWPLTGIPTPGRTLDCWDLNLGPDNNATGGVRLPHVETEVPGGRGSVGAPLANYRGAACFTASFPQILAADAITNCGPLPITSGAEVFALLAGVQIDYPAAQIRSLYRNHGGYVSSVAGGAEYAFDNRWILADAKDEYVAAASASDIGK